MNAPAHPIERLHVALRIVHRLQAVADAVAGPPAAGVVCADPGLNSDGWPLYLFHPSHSRTSDIVKTTHSRVRRISFMVCLQSNAMWMK